METGKRLMKPHQIMEETDKAIEDKAEKAKVFEGLLGSIMGSTQVFEVTPVFYAYTCACVYTKFTKIHMYLHVDVCVD